MPTVAKNIKDAIAETEKNKNNLAQTKSNIDNTLIELGGTKANNLNDIPNKIIQMLGKYQRMAKVTFNKQICDPGTSRSRVVNFNLAFNPKIAFAKVNKAYHDAGEFIYISSEEKCMIKDSSSDESYQAIINAGIDLKDNTYCYIYSSSWNGLYLYDIIFFG